MERTHVRCYTVQVEGLRVRMACLEKSKLEDADITFHEAEYQRLRVELQSAHEASRLPEVPGEVTRAALNDLLVRIRTRGLSSK